MLTLFFSAFVLGLIFNAAPGAVFAETVRQGARGGFTSAFAVQFGSLVGDAVWAALGLIGVGLLLQMGALRIPIGLAGVAYLLWLAWDSWRAARVELALGNIIAGQARRALRAGVTLSLTNPQNVAYWAALGSALGAVGVRDPELAHYAVFFIGFMVSSIVWAFVCAWLVSHLFKRARGLWIIFTYRVCALAFLALALSSLRELMAAAPTQVPADEPAILRTR